MQLRLPVNQLESKKEALHWALAIRHIYSHIKKLISKYKRVHSIKADISFKTFVPIRKKKLAEEILQQKWTSSRMEKYTELTNFECLLKAMVKERITPFYKAWWLYDSPKLLAFLNNEKEDSLYKGLLPIQLFSTCNIMPFCFFLLYGLVNLNLKCDNEDHKLHMTWILETPKGNSTKIQWTNHKKNKPSMVHHIVEI